MYRLPKTISFLFILVLLVSPGCSPHNSRIRKKEIIPEKDFIPVLVDLHLANAMFSLSSLRRKYPGTDSISNYLDIIAEHGYTLDDFEKTLTYYEDHLDDLEAIYAQVKKRLNDIERDVMGGENPLKYSYNRQNTNLWKEKTEWHLPREGTRNKIPYKIPVRDSGMYTLTLRVRLHKDDQSLNPAITLNFWYDDGTTEGKWIPVRKQKLMKDNRVHLYILSGTKTGNKITHLRGALLDHENPDTNFVKHADVFDVRIDFKPRQNMPK